MTTRGAGAEREALSTGASTGLARFLKRPAFGGVMPYVYTICGTGLLLVLGSLGLVLQEPQEAWRVLVVLSLFLAADMALVETRFGHNKEAFTLAETCLIVGLVLVPTPTLVVLAAVGVLVFHLASRISLVKALFNAASFAIGATLAGLVAEATDASLTEFELTAAAGLVAAALVFFFWNSVSVTVAVALSQGVRFGSVYRPGLFMRLLVCVGNSAVGLGVVALAQYNARSLLVLPIIVGVLYSVYRGYLHATQERDVWQQLEEASRELNRLDEREVAEAAIIRVSQLLKADWAEMSLEGDAVHAGAHYVGGADGIDDSRSGPRRTLSLLDADHDAPGQMSYSRLLEGPDGPFGVLRVCFRGSVQLKQRETQILKTFAHSVSATLQNARLYSEMRTHAEAKAYEASHDALTGLGNRVLLHDRAVLSLQAATETSQCGLLIVDLDHFKEINDTLGHAAGDIFLQQVGQRIVSAVDKADAVCRLGGDEFGVLIDGLPTPEQADAIATRLLHVLAQPVVFDGLRLSIEGSVGVACYPADASSFEELLQRADIALYQAKGSRGSVEHYRPERDESSLHRLALAAELRSALADDQFVVHFQPQYDLQTGAPVGAEALVRWQHPQRGLLNPIEFVSAVEHSGLIRDFTMTVLEKAVAECATWIGNGAALTVAVNLSARNLLDSELPVDVGRILLKHGLSAERLVLEITETTMMSELDVVEEVLATLRTMGVQLSVDDFGTGYSSLAFLQRVAVNEVKIDRSFVAGLSASESDRALVRATVQLAHSLGARAVGEGVEDEALAEALRALGCDFAQGYHFGRPMPAAALREKLGLRTAPGLSVAEIPSSAVPAPRSEGDSRHLRAVSGS